ncbi:4825_t:CDS:2, partial [Ambispora gerdemannii]
MKQKRKELAESERSQIVGAWQCNTYISTIVEKLEFAKSTVQDVITYYKNSEEIKPPARSGRPPILTKRDTRHLFRIIKNDKKVTLNVLENEFLQSTSIEVSTCTIQRYIHIEDFFARLARENHFDESRFEVFGGNGRSYVWILSKEKYDINYLIPTFKSGQR